MAYGNATAVAVSSTPSCLVVTSLDGQLASYATQSFDSINNRVNYTDFINLLHTPSASTDLYGTSVAISDDCSAIAVGAPGVAGGGAVYLFTGNSFATKQTINNPGTSTSALFGTSVAFSANGVLLIGAPSCQADTSSAPNGCAYVYFYQHDVWAYVLTPFSNEYNCNFGQTVAIDSKAMTFVVGAPQAVTNGVTGRVYFFLEDSTLHSTFVGSNGDSAGSSLALSDDRTAYVGTISNFLYTISSTNYTNPFNTTASLNPVNGYARSVAVTRDRSALVVGAPTFNAYLYIAGTEYMLMPSATLLSTNAASAFSSAINGAVYLSSTDGVVLFYPDSTSVVSYSGGDVYYDVGSSFTLTATVSLSTVEWFVLRPSLLDSNYSSTTVVSSTYSIANLTEAQHGELYQARITLDWATTILTPVYRINVVRIVMPSVTQTWAYSISSNIVRVSWFGFPSTSVVDVALDIQDSSSSVYSKQLATAVDPVAVTVGQYYVTGLPQNMTSPTAVFTVSNQNGTIATRSISMYQA
jgi:hypothetical protein